MKLLFIALGGALGSVLRYGISLLAVMVISSPLPWATWFVNLVGSFVAGFLFGWFESGQIREEFRLFLFAGVLGGFTTFSAFALETHVLVKSGDGLSALLNVVLTNAGGLALVFLGYWLSTLVRSAGS